MPNVTDEIRSELRQRVEARGTKYWAEFNETQAVELASGYVSGEVRAMFLSMLAWIFFPMALRRSSACEGEKPPTRLEISMSCSW